MMKFLSILSILLVNLLYVNSLNESFANWNLDMQGSDKVNLNLVEIYQWFVNSLALGAFKDLAWCYKPYPCFQIGGSFISKYHPVSLRPFTPRLMAVQMDLYTRKNPKYPFVFIDPNNISNLSLSYFNSSAPTKFLVGGYYDGNGKTLVTQLVSPLLADSDCNVFNVNWYNGSTTTYSQAVANIRLVGAILGRFIEILHNVTKLSISQCHVIGHSLGAHASGYAGQYLKGKLGRISGLDPAGPYFYETDPVVHLDKSDAQFVDILHTNAGTLLTGHFGIDQKIGHVDVYPNGGDHQPNCTTFLSINFGALANDLSILNSACSHQRSVTLYATSIQASNISDCHFTSFPCSNYSVFQSKMCLNCDNTVEMGYNSYLYAENNAIPAPYQFYLNTYGVYPFCENIKQTPCLNSL
ncbi:hypothetical protein CHUAL_001887 [Chamberlinius hualienensis]